MNAGAYGSDWSVILERAHVVSAEGGGWLTPTELGLSYRHSALSPGQVVARVEYRLAPRPADDIKAEVAELVARRKATQPTNKRTFGSVFKNPPGELGAGAMLERCGLRGHRIGGRDDLPAPRELHRERRRRDERRLPRADDRGPATRTRAVRRRARARGGALGPGVVCPTGLTRERGRRRATAGPRSARRPGRAQNSAPVAQRGRAGRTDRPRARAASVVVPLPRTAPGDRLELGTLVPSGRSLLVGFAVLGGVLISLVLARETSLFAVRTIEVAGAAPGVERQVRRALDERTGESLFAPRSRRRRRWTSWRSPPSPRSRSIVPIPARCGSPSSPSAPWPCCARGPSRSSSPSVGASSPDRSGAQPGPRADLGRPRRRARPGRDRRG